MGLKASAYTEGSSTFVKRNDVEAGPQKFTISNVEAAETPDKKPALQLVFGNGKKLTLNKTNARITAAAFGDDVDGWKGKQVVLYWDPTVLYQGKAVGGVKVRPVMPDPLAQLAAQEAAAPATGSGSTGTGSDLGF